jgi:membrane protein
MKLPASVQLVTKTFTAWADDYAPSMGAALAYYTMFSIAPLLLIVISVAGLIFGEDAVRGQVMAQLRELMGREGAHAVESMLVSVSASGRGTLATVFGVAILMFGATSVFGELQDALDRIWRVPSRAKTSSLWKFMRARLLSLGMIFGVGFLSLVSLVVSAGLAALSDWWGPFFGGWPLVLELTNFCVGFTLITLLIAFIYKVMPRASVKWRDVWIGSLCTALLFVIGKTLIGIYIGKSGVASGFGAAASLVVLLIWVYYSAQIFLLGAEFTWVFANERGSRKNSGQPAKRQLTHPTRSRD